MKFPFLTVFLGFAITALYLLFGNAPHSLIWISGEVTQRPWSLITAHLVHISAGHFIWNAAALLALSAIVEQVSRKDVVLALLIGMFAVNSYLTLLFDLNAYAGLSGILNTLLVIALHQLSCLEGYRSAAGMVLVASMLKIIFELNTASSLFSSLPWPAVPEAHLVGWLAGAVLVVVKHLVSVNRTAKYGIIKPSS